MLDQEAIEQQRQILVVHRRTLAHLLTQQATLTSAYTPPGVMQGIEEARENIRRIKAVLRINGLQVNDHPDDEPFLSSQLGEMLQAEKPQKPYLELANAALNGLDTSTREGQFWKWFVENSSKLSEFAIDPKILPSNDDPIIQELDTAFSKVAEGLTFEISGLTDFGREFIVSANGNRKLFAIALRLVGAAPVLPGWKFIAFRQSKDTHISLTFGDLKISGDDIWFKVTPDWEKLDIVLYIKGLTARNHKTMLGAAFIMLDNALGEYDVETKIGGIDLQPLPSKPERLGLKSFHSLPNIVQEWKPLDFEEAIKAFIESEYPLRVLLCHAPNDKPTVRKIYKKLISEGFNPWLDEENILPGQDWRRAIESAVQEAEAILIFLSTQSLTKDGELHQDIRRILKIIEKRSRDSLFLIPIRLENCVIPDSLEKWKWVNLFERRGHERLVQSLIARSKYIKYLHLQEHSHEERLL
jgi:hypothetical protein